MTILFFFLFFWVFEIQLLMQIIINRISVIAERQDTIRLLKWGTAGLITAINIAVFCIWIPAHMNPPVNDTCVDISLPAQRRPESYMKSLLTSTDQLCQDQ